MAKPVPNYHVKHINGWEANIHIPPKTERNLGSRDPEAKERARRTVCTRFRIVCQAKGNSYLHTPPPYWVKWEHLKLTKLEAPDSKKPADVSTEGEACDDCALCERGDHHLCASECTIGLRLLGR